MGDGYIDCYSDRNPSLEVGMISPNYLQYLANSFGVLGGGVYLKRSAAENAKRDKKTGFNPNAKEENYSDSYRWRSMNHPELEEFAAWYSSGEKVWPADTDLTPTVLKHWYCCDGHWHNSTHSNHIEIAMSNEIDSTNKIDNFFF